MSRITKQDTNGVKPLLSTGELGYDNYPAGGDVGRVYVGTGAANIALAKKTEVTAVDTKADTHIERVDNPHNVTKSQVGLANVTNESKATMFTSPTFTGVPIAPTATVGTNTTQLATTAFVNNEIINDVPANIHDATAKTTPADNDELALLDSASSFGLKKFSWLNIKNTIASFLNVQMFSGRMRIGGGADDTVNALQVNGSIYATNHRIHQGSFTVYGNQNTFYPVVFDPIDINWDTTLEISRFVHTDSTWLGTVRLKIHYGVSSWGGFPAFLKPIYCYSNRNTRVANISFSYSSDHLVVWLEGNASGVTYNYKGNNIALRGVYLGGFTDAQGANFPATTNLSTITTLY